MPRGPQSATIRPLQAPASPLVSLFTAPRSTIRGVSDTIFFGPLQPVKPFAPVGTEPRGFSYQPGQNLVYTPRADTIFDAGDLRRLAKYDLAQMCIQNVCDMICKMPITARLKRLEGETGKAHKARTKSDKLLPRLQNLIDYPNPEQTRQDFVRDILVDMLTGDWASIWVRRTRNGEVQELRAIDGSTITRYINENGFTPTPKEGLAYAQYLNNVGVIADFDTTQLIYAMRNKRRDGLYGVSPTEQGAQEIEIGIQRMNWVLQFYTAGSIPDLIQLVPMGIDPDKIKEDQDWLDSTLSGQLAKRRGMRLVQSFFSADKWPSNDQIITPKDKALSDDFDDRHIRKVAFLYGTSPQRLLKTLNRATGQANQEAAEEEGTMPWIDWLTHRVYNWLFQRNMQLPGYEVTIDIDVETDELKQAQTDDIDARNGVRTLNQIRDDRGLDPHPQEEANEPLIITATGPVPLDGDAAAERSATMAEAAFVPPQPDDSGKPGGGKPSGKPGGNKPKPKKAWAY